MKPDLKNQGDPFGYMTLDGSPTLHPPEAVHVFEDQLIRASDLQHAIDTGEEYEFTTFNREDAA